MNYYSSSWRGAPPNELSAIHARQRLIRFLKWYYSFDWNEDFPDLPRSELRRILNTSARRGF